MNYQFFEIFRKNSPPEKQVSKFDITKTPFLHFFMGFGAIFQGKSTTLTKYQLFVYKKLIIFFAVFLKKLLHFFAIFSIIVMLRGEYSHESD